MNRLIKSLLIFSVIISLIPITSYFVSAESDLLCPNGQYELDRATANGDFEKIACYTDFNDAKENMIDNDMVIRYSESQSRMKIIAMKQGVAYSYLRNGGATTNIYQYSNKSGKNTYVSGYYEMVYLEAGNNSNGDGMVYVNLNGFNGYTELSSLDLVPQVFIDNDVVIEIGTAININARRSYYSVRQNGNYHDLIYTYFRSYPDNESSSKPKSYTVSLGPAPEGLEEGLKYYSNNGYDFYSDVSFNNLITSSYPYYEYLPLRSKTTIDAGVFDNFINKKIGATSSKMKDTGQIFIDNQDKYGVNALMVFALGCLESAYGTSSIATAKNNLFGWEAVDSSPGSSATTFDSVEQAVREQMALNLSGYLDAFNWKYFGSHVGNKGSGFNVKYASDPYWGMKISGIAYEIDKLSKNNDGSLTDYNGYDLFLAPVFGSKIYRDKTFGDKLYSLDYAGLMQEANIQIAKEITDDYIIVQSSNLLLDGDPLKTKYHSNEYFNYDFDNFIGYMKPQELVSINNDNLINEPSIGEYISEVNDLTIANGVMKISGVAYRTDYYSSSQDDLEHYLVFESENDKKEIKLNQVKSNLGSYQAAAFESSDIDLSFLTKDTSYRLFIKTVSKKFTEINNIDDDYKISEGSNGYNYELFNKDSGLVIFKKKISVDTYYNVSVDEYSLVDGVLKISGIGLVEGVNNSENSIEHKLNFVDLDSGEIYKSVVLNSNKGKYNLNDAYNDPYDYSYGWYEGEVNVKDFNFGEYSLQLETIISNESYKRNLSIKYNDLNVKNQIIDKKNISLVKQYYYSYRLELKIHSYYLENDKSDELPSIKESYLYISNMEFDSQNKELTISGSSVIWKVDMSSNTTKYKLYLINKNTGEIYSQEVNGVDELSTNSWNQSEALNGKYDNSWFNFKFDVSKFEKGTYTGLLRVETNKFVDYVDLKTNANIEWWITNS